MDLHALEAVDHVDARILQFLGPGDVALLVETGLQLHHGRDLLAAPPGLHERPHDGRIGAYPVKGLLDGHHVRVLAGLSDKFQHGTKTVVRVVEQPVLGADGRKHAFHAADVGLTGVLRRQLEAEPVTP